MRALPLKNCRILIILSELSVKSSVKIFLEFLWQALKYIIILAHSLIIYFVLQRVRPQVHQI